jgi:hypothetical protein
VPKASVLYVTEFTVINIYIYNTSDSGTAFASKAIAMISRMAYETIKVHRGREVFCESTRCSTCVDAMFTENHPLIAETRPGTQGSRDGRSTRR